MNNSSLNFPHTGSQFEGSSTSPRVTGSFALPISLPKKARRSPKTFSCQDIFRCYCLTVGSSAQRFVVLEMASGGEDPSGSNQEMDPEEDELVVVRDTEGVFRHFVFQRYQDETEREEQSGEMNSPTASVRPDALEELRSCNDEHPFSQHVPVIGRRLLEIGDEIDAKYKDQFRDMIDSLSLTPATAYETFAALARRLFRSGISWGRIVALLCFGYEIAVTVIRKGFSGSFLRRIVRFVVDFIFNERIARWIAERGGWRAVLDYRLSEPSWYTIGIVLLLGTIVAFYATRKTGT